MVLPNDMPASPAKAELQRRTRPFSSISASPSAVASKTRSHSRLADSTWLNSRARPMAIPPCWQSVASASSSSDE
jgi:hypothetical protein